MPRPAPPATPRAMAAILAVIVLVGTDSAMLARRALAAPPPEPLLLHRQAEPRERAFTILVPEGWQVEGGILRVDPVTVGGPAQSLEAKVDLTLRQDAPGTVMLRRYPDWYGIDMRHSPAGQMGFFPPGSTYQGMPVAQVPDPRSYVLEWLLPQVRPAATDLQVEAAAPVPGLVRAARERVRALAVPLDIRFDGCVITVTYRERGIRFRERFVVLIEDRGAMAGGQWANRETLGFRAPAADFAAWEPVFQLICGSVQLSPDWIRGELRGQQQRVQTMREVERQVRDLDRQILAHQRTTNAEIQNDAFLTLTAQEEYVNPYTGEVEVGTDQLGPHRWVTAGGDVLYAPREEFDPNTDARLNRTDWKRTPVRERGP